jgi:hypothetical protein
VPASKLLEGLSYANAKCFVLILLAAFSAAADEDSRWSIAAECQMVVLPQKLALPLVSDLNDDGS